MLDFEKSLDEFNKMNIQVLAASTDTPENARETVERYKITFAVGYGLDAKEVSSKTGAFYEGKEGYIHATGFIINPEGKVTNGVYSTLAVGRLAPKDCLALIEYFMKH